MTRLRPEGLPPDAGKKVSRIAVPVGFEFSLVLALTFVNQIIVGGLGGTAIAAVGFANSIHTIPLFFLGALNVGAGVVVGRAFGGGNQSVTSRATTYVVVLSVASGTLVAIPFVMFPSQILSFAGASLDVVSVGSGYLALVLASLGAGVLSMVLSSVLRSVNRARSPMVATIVSVALNVPLAIVFVYGFGPIPALGVLGAGLATLITTSIRAAVLLAQVYLIYDVANWVLPRGAKQWVNLGRPILVLAVPMALTSMSWTFGNFFYNVIVQQLGDGPLAALQIVFALSGVFVVGSIGLGSAITVLASQAIGAGDPILAQRWITYLLRIGIITGIGFAVLFALSALLLPVFFPNIEPSVLGLATWGIVINAIIQPLSVRMLLLASVLPAGNDTTGIIIGDFSGPYLIGLPLTLVLGLLTPLGVLGAVIGKGTEDILKMLIFSYRARKIRWDDVLKAHEDSLVTMGDFRTGPITIDLGA
jgi:putative MATE family efflux protein